jgi:hypothetical protein
MQRKSSIPGFSRSLKVHEKVSYLPPPSHPHPSVVHLSLARTSKNVLNDIVIGRCMGVRGGGLKLNGLNNQNIMSKYLKVFKTLKIIKPFMYEQ